MAKEEKVRTQISWGELGGRLFADMPITNERLWFDPKELHESWKDFIILYGIKQFASSNISGESFPVKAERDALRKANPELTDEQIVEALKAAKAEWLKANVNNLRTALWKELASLKVEKVKKETAARESKAAAVNAAVVAENERLIALATENAKKLGIPVEIAMQLMGVKPIDTTDEADNDEDLDNNDDN